MPIGSSTDSNSNWTCPQRDGCIDFTGFNLSGNCALAWG